MPKIGPPERQLVEQRHGSRQPHPNSSRGTRRLYRELLQQLFPIGEQVFDDRLAPGGRGLAEFIGALVAPEALLPLNDELFHVAQVRARLANEVAAGKLQLMQIVAAKT